MVATYSLIVSVDSDKSQGCSAFGVDGLLMAFRAIPSHTLRDAETLAVDVQSDAWAPRHVHQMLGDSDLTARREPRARD